MRHPTFPVSSANYEISLTIIQHFAIMCVVSFISQNITHGSGFSFFMTKLRRDFHNHLYVGLISMLSQMFQGISKDFIAEKADRTLVPNSVGHFFFPAAVWLEFSGFQ